jgi:hypothetical protein
MKMRLGNLEMREVKQVIVCALESKIVKNYGFSQEILAVLGLWIRIRIHMFLGLSDPHTDP